MQKVRQGDIGTIFRARFVDGGSAVNVSGVSTKQLKFRKPDGTTLTKTATFTTTGADGYIEYATLTGDLSLPGKWAYQGYVTGLGGWSGHTEEIAFEVESIIGG